VATQPFRSAVLAFACLACSSCATLGRATFREPVVTYKDAVVTGLGLSGGSIDVVLGIYNPNNFRLDGTSITYRFSVDSVPFGSGIFSDQFTVPQGDSTELRLPLSFTYSGVGQAGRQILQTGSVQYTVSGDITVSTPIGSFTRPYTGRGRLTVLR
jgi:LEA14-like dessication related protein